MHTSRVQGKTIDDVDKCTRYFLYVYEKILRQWKRHKRDTDDKIGDVDTCIFSAYTCTKISREADGHNEWNKIDKVDTWNNYFVLMYKILLGNPRDLSTIQVSEWTVWRRVHSNLHVYGKIANKTMDRKKDVVKEMDDVDTWILYLSHVYTKIFEVVQWKKTEYRWQMDYLDTCIIETFTCTE